MKLKNGVSISGLRPEILVALIVAEGIAREEGSEIVVTSGVDGQHRAGSLHYVGLAVDLRRWNLRDPTAFVDRLKESLGPSFDVLLERTHIHVEFQPKGPAK